MTWLLPEPITKAVAATLTVLLVAWLGLDTVWGLMDGWVGLVTQAYEATTFAQLQSAGAQYAHVLGTDAARALILAAGVVTGQAVGALAKTARPLAGELAARVRSLPGYLLAEAQWEAQGGSAVLGQVRVVQAQQVEVPRALAVAAETVETILSSPQGPLSLVLFKQGGAGPGPGGSTTVIRHRGGNQQVVLANGQRWHLPRGKSLADIPAQDPVGDQLQEAVTRAAQRWGPDRLSPNEKEAIREALKKGRYWLARLLEREARGRFVQKQVYEEFKYLYEWNLNKGVDVVDPDTGVAYEILSGTESNLVRHGRRMATDFFRMIFF